MELHSLAEHTQSQFQFLRYTTLQQTIQETGIPLLISQSQPELVKRCLAKIDTVNNDTVFTNRSAQEVAGSDSRNGVLLGEGDIHRYSVEALNLLCTVLTTSNKNSEVVRLIKPHPVVNSLFYFVAKNNDYLFMYNRAFADTKINEYIVPHVRTEFEQYGDGLNDYWISGTYTDIQTKKPVLTFVQNIKDYHNQVIGFLARDVLVEDLSRLISQALNQRDDNIRLMDYARITIFNNNKIIFNQDPKADLTGKKLLDFRNDFLDRETSEFGRFIIDLHLPVGSMVKLIFDEQPYLYIIPLLVFFFCYLILQQVMHGIRESDKQFFDSLTGVYNRHGLQQKVHKKVEKAIASDKKVHIFSIDANKFKQINDKYGHDTGDKAIILISKAAKHICKPFDDIVRLGGDEFLVVLYIDAKVEFDPNTFMNRFNQKLAYDCKANMVPNFTVSGGYVNFGAKSHQTLSQAIKEADALLLNKKSIDKIDTICEEFDSFDINISEHEQEIKLDMSEKLNFVHAEHLLQSELNEKVLTVYRTQLGYVISNYFQMIYSCKRENDDLHHYRMKIVESHYAAGIPMSVFYFLFIKYSNFLFRDFQTNHDEFVVNNRLMSYELHFISSLKTR
ncbi:MAG: diguanylate cyclase domain-containing protein [Vibrio sp.]